MACARVFQQMFQHPQTGRNIYFRPAPMASVQEDLRTWAMDAGESEGVARDSMCHSQSWTRSGKENLPSWVPSWVPNEHVPSWLPGTQIGTQKYSAMKRTWLYKAPYRREVCKCPSLVC